jgi:serine protease Do
MKKLIKALFIIIVLLLAGGIGSFLFQSYILPKVGSSPTLSKLGIFKKASENITIVNKTEQVIVNEENSINKIASQASASVVNIISIPENKNKTLNSIGSKNGTGVIVTSDGMIATYRTAILESDARYEVLLHNGSLFEAKLSGIDGFTNLAFLKIDASNLSVVSFANSSDSFPGKKLIAIGNSFEEYQNRYAGGILGNINKTFNLSGKTLSSSEKLEGIFETDINFKKNYLGGIIIDYSGELVGIIGSVSIDNQENFFEIPSNTIKNSIEWAIKNELNKRPYLGIYYISLTKSYAIANNLDRDRGAIIYSPSGKQGLAIIAGSPAEKAGLKINDTIIKVNEKEINLENPLSNLLNQYKKGDKIELTALREGQEMKFQVQL